MARRSTQSNWSDLPTELLHLILKKLDCANIMRFKAVSSSWCLAANSYTSSPLYTPFSQSPWLMYPSNNHENHSFFFNFAERKLYKLNNVLKGLDHEAWCAGSSHGWLIIFDSRGNSIVLNPFSGEKIELPSTKPLHDKDRINVVGNHAVIRECNRVTKAILTWDPSRTKSFSVVVIYGLIRSLAFYMHGGENITWTSIGTTSACYYDIIYHNNHLYALVQLKLEESHKPCIEVWNFGNNFPTKVATIIAPDPAGDQRRFIDQGAIFVRFCGAYLAESLGEILLVNIYTALFNDRKEITKHIYAYKLDYWGERWEDVVTLGDQALFLGKNIQPISVSARMLQDWKENSIFFGFGKELCFCDNNTIRLKEFQEVREYNFEEKALKLYMDMKDVHNLGKGFGGFGGSFWIIPNPW